MAISQFEKRKAKATVKETTSTPVVETQAPEQTLTHSAFDIYLDPADNAYKIATIQYNPLTREASVQEIGSINRQVGLIHDNHKRALETLKKY